MIKKKTLNLLKKLAIIGIIAIAIIAMVRTIRGKKKTLRRRKTRRVREKFQNGGGNRIAILLRGKHDAMCHKSFEEMVYKPLVNAGNSVDVYIVTYHSENDEKLKKYSNVKEIFWANDSNNQVQTFVQGLKSIPNNYDLYICLRFDLIYKKPFTEFMPTFSANEKRVWVAWKEYKSGWEEHKRVADTIHLVTKDAKDEFISVLEAGFSQEIHRLYNSLSPKMPIHFLVDGFFDSNTSTSAIPEMKNPIYIFNNRPYYHNDKPQVDCNE
jgi:hypothetical protein